jgi:hypothetical protein
MDCYWPIENDTFCWISFVVLRKTIFWRGKKKCFANAIWLDSAGFNPLQGDQIEQLFTFSPPPPPACFSNCSFSFTALLTGMS